MIRLQKKKPNFTFMECDWIRRKEDAVNEKFDNFHNKVRNTTENGLSQNNDSLIIMNSWLNHYID